MTSSLVGLGDVYKRQSTRGPAVPATGGPPLKRGKSTRNSRSNAWPVSYTHLTLPTICSV
eukprot:5983227-Prorocentrum_lima.AAC.1